MTATWKIHSFGSLPLSPVRTLKHLHGSGLRASIKFPSQLVFKRVGPNVWVPYQMVLWSNVAFSQCWLLGRASFLATRAFSFLISSCTSHTSIRKPNYQSNSHSSGCPTTCRSLSVLSSLPAFFNCVKPEAKPSGVICSSSRD